MLGATTRSTEFAVERGWAGGNRAGFNAWAATRPTPSRVNMVHMRPGISALGRAAWKMGVIFQVSMHRKIETGRRTGKWVSRSKTYKSFLCPVNQRRRGTVEEEASERKPAKEEPPASRALEPLATPISTCTSWRSHRKILSPRRRSAQALFKHSLIFPHYGSKKKWKIYAE